MQINTVLRNGFLLVSIVVALWLCWILWLAQKPDEEEPSTHVLPSDEIIRLRSQQGKTGWHVGYTELAGGGATEITNLNAHDVALVNGTPFCVSADVWTVRYAWGKVPSPAWQLISERFFTSSRNPRWWTGYLSFEVEPFNSEIFATAVGDIQGKPLITLLSNPAYVVIPIGEPPYRPIDWDVDTLDPPLHSTHGQGLALVAVENVVMIAAVDILCSELRVYWLLNDEWYMQVVKNNCGSVVCIDLVTDGSFTYMSYVHENQTELVWFEVPSDEQLTTSNLLLGDAYSVSLCLDTDELHAALYNQASSKVHLASLSLPLSDTSQPQFSVVTTLEQSYSYPQVVVYRGKPIVIYTTDSALTFDPNKPGDVHTISEGRGQLMAAWPEVIQGRVVTSWRIEEVDRISGTAHNLSCYIIGDELHIGYRSGWEGMKIAWYIPDM